MKYIKEILWIMLFAFLGEGLSRWLPLPAPAGVYGLLLLLLCLLLGIVKPEEIEHSGNFLLDTMTVMFLPAAAGIMSMGAVLMPVLLPYAVTISASTVLVMLVTGCTAERILRKKRRREREEAANKGELPSGAEADAAFTENTKGGRAL